MPSYRLRFAADPPGARWLLEWDDITFRLRDPEGRPAVEVAAAEGYRLVGIRALYVEGKVRLVTPDGSPEFEKHRAAAAGLRAFVEKGLRTDPEYLARLRRDAAWEIPGGLVMLVVAGGLFGLYCWWAFTHDDPPPGTWLRWAIVWFGWLISGVLFVLMSFALAGPLVSYTGLRMWWRFHRLGRAAK